jgi:hypothetical protein
MAERKGFEPLASAVTVPRELQTSPTLRVYIIHTFEIKKQMYKYTYT